MEKGEHSIAERLFLFWWSAERQFSGAREKQMEAATLKSDEVKISI